MEPINFVYWLRGFIEIQGTEHGMTPAQLEMVNKHLNLILTCETEEKESPVEDVKLPPPNLIIETKRTPPVGKGKKIC